MDRLAGIALLLAAVLTCAPAQAARERILLFDSRIEVGADGALTVTETIRVHAEGREIRRGIFRDFPTRYVRDDGRIHTVGFEVLEVLRDGEPEPWFQQMNGNMQRVYIGREEVALRPGDYTYELTYRTTRQIGFFDGHDELYWNVTGNGWTFPIRAARATVVLPDGAEATRHQAYTGLVGARGRDWRYSTDAAGNASFETTRTLSPRAGFTVVVAWPKGHVALPTVWRQAAWHLRDNLHWVIALLSLAAVLAYYVFAWARVGRDPAMGTIIPLFAPPEKVSPAHARYVMRMKYDEKTLTAAVVNLAARGFLKIDRTEDGHHRLSLCDEMAGEEPASRDERDFMTAFFGDSKRVVLKKGKARTAWIARQAHEKSVESDCDEIYHKRNYGYGTVGFFLSFLMLGPWIYGLMVEPTTRGTVLAAAGVTMLVLVNILFNRLLPAPTRLGHEVKKHLEGFRMYLGTAEQDRLEGLHPPERTPVLFEKYLPFAIALDVENEWGEQFRDVLAVAAVAGAAGAYAYQPHWYDGGFDSDGFSAGSFGGELSSSLGSSLSAASTPPPGTSSGFSGSGSSSGGFSGGGSSGGGGGGGGGGGW